MDRPLIALTTDFGVSSAYVAQMKGVILSSLPDANIIDVTHDIAPQSIRQAETVLRSTAFCLPLGTVHVVVVDPGVGTSRRPIAVQSRGMTFVGPDNGVLGIALAQPDARAVVLDKPELHRQPTSATFHGRDIFAPVAAELAGGLALETVGTPISDPQPSTLPQPVVTMTQVDGELLGADVFGNMTTNIPARAVGPGWRVEVQGQEAHWVNTYAEGAMNVLLALTGSDGYLELAVREGSAARLLDAKGSEKVRCRKLERA